MISHAPAIPAKHHASLDLSLQGKILMIPKPYTFPESEVPYPHRKGLYHNEQSRYFQGTRSLSQRNRTAVKREPKEGQDHL